MVPLDHKRTNQGGETLYHDGACNDSACIDPPLHVAKAQASRVGLDVVCRHVQSVQYYVLAQYSGTVCHDPSWDVGMLGHDVPAAFLCNWFQLQTGCRSRLRLEPVPKHYRTQIQLRQPRCIGHARNFYAIFQCQTRHASCGMLSALSKGAMLSPVVAARGCTASKVLG